MRMMDTRQWASEEKLTQLRAAVEALGGHEFGGRSGVESIESAGLAARIKQQLDPNGILPHIP